MISRTTDYALRAMVVLGTESQRCWRHLEIAKITQVPPGYLSKVMQSLARAELVTSQRGVNGGFTLSREPSRISVLEVVNAVDPIERINSCPLGLKAHGTNLCALHRKLDLALEMVEKAFATSTLADLIHEGSSSRVRPCDFPLKKSTSVR